MRFLGIDFGEKRVGVAEGDSRVGIAVPHSTLGRTNDRQLIAELKALAVEAGTEVLVVGEPRRPRWLNRTGGGACPGVRPQAGQGLRTAGADSERIADLNRGGAPAARGGSRSAAPSGTGRRDGRADPPAGGTGSGGRMTSDLPQRRRRGPRRSPGPRRCSGSSDVPERRRPRRLLLWSVAGAVAALTTVAAIVAGLVAWVERELERPRGNGDNRAHGSSAGAPVTVDPRAVGGGRCDRRSAEGPVPPRIPAARRDPAGPASTGSSSR